ncbi:MAG: hypothetical protein KME60_08225 [Cyanomargarita calcarea GSE-NOS-MK-12-04C]|jgi:hypothetical protein|uniref:Uncharacterized protein n=1 Tax=Cyanomargarita calcarea GSE-NOS-MK-12-04C TaxID=2839659 RepID=A0A951USM2_9CYAN|nr:hypothetical protein [Cyanomargarita calcarea GSE-NOS-MK-12-04C]
MCIFIQNWYYRLPKDKSEREQLGLKIGFDGHYLLHKIWPSEIPQCDLRQLETVETLRKIWIQQYTFDKSGLV